MTLKIFAASSLLAISLVASVSSAQVAEENVESSIETFYDAPEMYLSAPEIVDASLRDRPGRGGDDRGGRGDRDDRRDRREMYQCSANGIRNNRRLFYGQIFQNRHRAAQSAIAACEQYRNYCELYECRRVR